MLELFVENTQYYLFEYFKRINRRVVFLKIKGDLD